MITLIFLKYNFLKVPIISDFNVKAQVPCKDVLSRNAGINDYSFQYYIVYNTLSFSFNTRLKNLRSNGKLSFFSEFKTHPQATLDDMGSKGQKAITN